MGQDAVAIVEPATMKIRAYTHEDSRGIISDGPFKGCTWRDIEGLLDVAEALAVSDDYISDSKRWEKLSRIDSFRALFRAPVGLEQGFSVPRSHRQATDSRQDSRVEPTVEGRTGQTAER